MYRKFYLPLAALLLAACTHHSDNTADSASVVSDSEQSAQTSASVQNPVDTFSYKGYEQMAQLLSGTLPQGSDFMPAITSLPAYANHRSSITSAWDSYTKISLGKIREWSSQNLTEKADTVFYPFGGPDFNYLNSFFPDSKFAVLIGIEPPGAIPFLKNNDKASRALSTLGESVRCNLYTSFFRTKSMKAQLNSELEGTLPVVLMMMGLHGCEVINVNPVEVNEQGEIVYTDPQKVWAHTLDKKYDKGYEIMYRTAGSPEVRKFNYLSMDLSNGEFKRGHLDKMVERYFKGETTFLKAASYLMHNPFFSDVRNAILNNAGMVLSGPSGIPFVDFKPENWDITLYGRYTPPISLFPTRVQPEMKEAYEKGNPKPINFRFDYGQGAGFILARRK